MSNRSKSKPEKKSVPSQRRAGERRPRRSATHPTRLMHQAFEFLEDRHMMTCGFAAFNEALGHVDNVFSQVESSISFVANNLGDVPLVGKQLQGPFNKLTNDFGNLQSELANANAVGNFTEAAAKEFLFDLLGPANLDLLADGSDEGTDISADDIQVEITEPNGFCNVDIQMNLRRELISSGVNVDFSVGVASLPIKVDVNGGIDVSVGFRYDNLHFGYSTDPNVGFQFWDNGPAPELTLYADAHFAPGTTLSANVGFLKATVADGYETTDENGNSQFHTSSLSLELPVDVNLAGGILEPGDPRGHADVYLQVDAATGLGGNFPSVAAGFELHSNFGGFGGKADTLTAEFHDVTVDLGEYFTQLVGPLVGIVKDVAEPIQPILSAINSRIPVLSDIPVVNTILGDGDTDVSLLEVAKFANGIGATPEGYSELIEVVGIVSDIVDIVNMIETNGSTITMNLGDFTLINDQGGSLKDLSAAKDVAGDSQKIIDDHLQIEGYEELDLAAIRDEIKSVLPQELHSTVDTISQHVADRFAQGVHYSFPILENPAASVFQVLIGRDADFFRLTANLNLDPGNGGFPCGAVPGLGFEACFQGGIGIDAKVDVGYDTYGLRRFIQTKSPGELLDGIYLSQDSHFHLSGEVAAHVGASYLVFHAGAEGGVRADVKMDLAQATDNFDGDASKVRLISELGECMFTASGDITAYLEAYARIGIDSPFGDITLAEEHFDIAKVVIHLFESNCIANPRHSVADPALAELDANTGVLTLNVGSRGGLRNVGKGEEAEIYKITTADGGQDDQSGVQSVLVSAFGRTQRFDGVKSIVGDAGSGKDRITVTADVFVPAVLHGGGGDDELAYAGSNDAELHGDDGHDRLVYHGSGYSELYGGGGNDHLEGGHGPQNILLGGADDDTLIGGGEDASTVNLMGDNVLESGNDVLFGGLGINVMLGGDGNDRLVAGPLSDALDGGAGDDILEAGGQTYLMLGGRDNDQFLWHVGDGSPQIDGGGGNDLITLFGGDHDDAFAVSAHGSGVRLDAPGGSSFVAVEVENIDIEGQAGGDTIVVNSLAGTEVTSVGVNLGDVLNRDQATDHVLVFGTDGDDTAMIDVEQVVVSETTLVDPYNETTQRFQELGGVMRVRHLPNYTVRLANLDDDFVFNALQGDDHIAIDGNTGPTLLLAGEGDDAITVRAHRPGDSGQQPDPAGDPQHQPDYHAVVRVDGGSGANSLHVDQSASEIRLDVNVSKNLITSNLLPGVWFTASGGDFSGGVHVGGGNFDDKFNVLSTLPGVVTLIKAGVGDDIVRVSSSAPDLQGNLDEIEGHLAIDAGSGANFLYVSDKTSQTANSGVAINASTITGLAGAKDDAVIGYLAAGGQLALAIVGSDNANDNMLISNPNATTTVLGGGGNDRLMLGASTLPVGLGGGDGDDRIDLGDLLVGLDAVQGDVIVYGHDGVDQMTMLDVPSMVGHQYEIHDKSIERVGGVKVLFDADLDLINVATGAGSDQFHVSEVPVTKMHIMGGGGLGLDTVTGPDAVNFWRITAASSGTLNGDVSFQHVELIYGGSQPDIFTMENDGSVLTIDGGAGGGDVLDYTAVATPIAVNLATESATNVSILHGVEHFSGSSIGGDMLIAPATLNTWQVMGANSGALICVGAGVYSFDSIESLVGGTNADTYSFGPSGELKGSIQDPGGAHDRLDYSQWSQGVIVNLQTGSATQVGLGVAGIENVTGGKRNDLLFGNSAGNTLVGGGGHDILVGNGGDDLLLGGDGRDLLIGGGGSDSLDGGADDDVLIGGSTDFDSNSTALLALLNEWTQPADYVKRVAKLRGGAGPNGQYKLQPSTVFDDLAADQLTGGTGRDWFWQSAVDTVLDLAKGEYVN